MPLLDDCLEFLKKEDVKNQIKHFCKPMIDVIMQEISIYIYILFLLLILSICMNILMLFYFSRFNRNVCLLKAIE